MAGVGGADELELKQWQSAYGFTFLPIYSELYIDLTTL